ncbi:MAG: peptide chain release factor N(5)-glutamine methyltransferase [Candidatus Magasanikbacteria bacterium CG_4_10_14_0_2_um_filter_33_14]|uniref:Peptide chain release factor N(5)-glutamine methyltransferase n=1 Tax=Candidatus Magasanikbacteria bacterium CG_4_10_14_0_2_um_filter_33_14 TaxID=1974636 RepID=A0A2M7V8G1_9BACT|nr:MAG: peptide chain release factor N(5)-glutamine methyltransferase [Candidatus Magasanikbacteria bacterium CG_4_10_14_0_2_um_filter_33_14]
MKITVKKLLTNNKKISLLDKEILLSHVIKKSREFLFANPDFEISFWQKIKFESLLRQRQKNIPIAYLIRHKEFFGLDFFVNKNVLVPRPDTELMVATAIAEINEQGTENKNILLIDVGTGTGCIPIAIRKSVLSANPNFKMETIAIDISKKALCVAKKNAKKHNVEIEFLHGNLLEPIFQLSELRTENTEIIITANLPYITEQQFKQEPSIQKEPKLALVADNEGLALYEELLKQIKQLLLTLDFRLLTMFEIDPTQTDKIKIMIKKYLPEANIEIKKDLAGLDRLVIIT